MTIKDQLREIAGYYEVNRMVGHTTAMVNGAKQTKKVIILTTSRSMMGCLCNRFGLSHGMNLPTKFISTRNLLQLRGNNLPLLIDNEALWHLFNEAAKRIEELETQAENRLFARIWRYIRRRLRLK